jgi:hypothetical protein
MSLKLRSLRIHKTLHHLPDGSHTAAIQDVSGNQCWLAIDDVSTDEMRRWAKAI